MDRQESVDAEGGHGVLFRLEPELYVIRLPRALLLIFTEAHGVLAGPAEGRAIGIAGITAADGDENQTNGASDGRVGAKAGTEHAGIAVYIERCSYRSIEKQRRSHIA